MNELDYWMLVYLGKHFFRMLPLEFTTGHNLPYIYTSYTRLYSICRYVVVSVQIRPYTSWLPTNVSSLCASITNIRVL